MIARLIVNKETASLRRHDLDALRGFAMLLGILLHAGMSFLPGIKPLWGVEDIYASNTYGLMNHLIHGWRMQLFFLISGFFTMMLWRKRGSKALLIHRFKRILLPLVLAMMTITPVWWIAQGYVRGNDEVADTVSKDESKIDIWKAVFEDDVDEVKTYLDSGGDRNLTDPGSGSSLLHAACFYGKPESAIALVASGANREATNRDGLTPFDLLAVDWETTQYVATITGIQIVQDEVDRGRDEIRVYLEQIDGKESETSAKLIQKAAGGSISSPETKEETLPSTSSEKEIDIFEAVLANDEQQVQSYIENDGDPNVQEPSNGSTPLHAACFFGKADAAVALIQGGAKLDALNNDKQTPISTLYVDWETTQFIASIMQQRVDFNELSEGRTQIANFISKQIDKPIDPPQLTNKGSKGLEAVIGLLFYAPIFNHLWFLWFLWWIVVLFLITASVCGLIGLPLKPSRLMHSPLALTFLIPMTALPQYFMARGPGGFGPDTSISLIPLPAVFTYYVLFFFAGAFYYSDEPKEEKKGSSIVLLFILAGIVFIAAHSVDPYAERAIFSLLQSTYAWLMTFGMIGFFSQFFAAERYWVRYLSDSSYWLYLVHLPLVLILQDAVENWTLASGFKFALINVTAAILLLISYQFLVRNTWIGLLLNGRRYPR